MATDGLIGQKVFGFEIRDWVGQGGFARVYKAVHPHAKTVAALKIFPAPLAENEKFRERFENEEEVWGRLMHDRIVRFITGGFESIGPTIAMEYVEGPSLEAKMQQQSPLPVPEALKITAQLLEALDYAHRQGAVHSDVHPGNVLLGPSGAMLTDFGLTRIVHEGQGRYMNYYNSNPSMGLTAFATPEADKGIQLTPQSDIYQAGLVLAYMLGRSPRNTKPLERINPKVHPDLIAIVEKSTEERPDDRYQSAAEFAQAISVYMSPAQFRAYPARIQHLVVAGNDVLEPAAIKEVEAKRSELEKIASDRGLPFDLAALDRDIAVRKKADAERITAYAINLAKRGNSVPDPEKGATVSTATHYLATAKAWGIGGTTVNY